MFDAIMAIPESEMIEENRKSLYELNGIKLTTKIRLHLGLMQSVIETLMASGQLHQPELYTLLLDLGKDLKELIEELENEQA